MTTALTAAIPLDAANDDMFAIRLDDEVSSLNWLATTSVNRDARSSNKHWDCGGDTHSSKIDGSIAI